jgi:Family of unknown function (DUF6328)
LKHTLGLKSQLVEAGHRYAVAGLVLLLLSLVGAVHLAASFVLGSRATLLAAGLAALFATLWFLVPSTGSGTDPSCQHELRRSTPINH